ncbi:hypothetical protein BLL52_0373 [Rhodoferax antarcticus ANT.BR]|uniref:Uncharacterized protein n=1 Tax=Rhodoferax antarcticus ANT.BR TaxID=1111071 RepID=A0A1Q8YBN8_9BURK|nr:hypothetical protein BLL52_3900 [Rhodoferax antarcticus ANT.BR]OLP05448.1 hypothetical protein BLL52_3115 [Rhodoferax antarcticus ANT.BR]OLP05454.1 hypothetical protein BLL52_3121 [Rhodoferax antarcticus ANT.BR]OLP05637.1 hypothetical protein BLL52_3089 [Rhodoferax antarcticus ANT.BR]OLP06654.1 hypothetical protein BLL52_2890 [Rhodoferax antarcticus ANT.BR]
MSCANTSVPLCMTVWGGNPQKTDSLTHHDVQIETRLKHQI